MSTKGTEVKEATKAQKERLNSRGLNRYEIHLTNEMLEEIESIATMNGAKVHHLTNKPIIKDTVISLLELGIKCIYEGVDLPKKSNTPYTDNNNRIDLTVLDSRIEDKLKPLYSLVSELSDKINRIAYTDNNNDTDNDNRINLTVLNDNELIGVEKTEDNLLGAILTNIHNEETTKESTLSESPNLPLSEDSPQIVPTEENKPENEDKPEKELKLSARQKEILERMKGIESGKTFESQSKLGDFLGLNKSEKPHLTKIKPLWENIIFSIESVNGSNQLVKL